MREITDFAEIEQTLTERCMANPWCQMATVDRKGRPRQRVVHPVWEGSTGYVLSGKDSLKGKHIAANPHVSLGYVSVNPPMEILSTYADCTAEWIDDVEEKRRLWELFKTTPPPYGYDPALFSQAGPDSPDVYFLKLTPWRLEISSLMEVMQGQQIVWRGEG